MFSLRDYEILKLLNDVDDTSEVSDNLSFEECAGILEINNGKLCFHVYFVIQN